jgi:hypothetical protein
MYRLRQGGCCLISRGFPVAAETATGAWADCYMLRWRDVDRPYVAIKTKRWDDEEEPKFYIMSERNCFNFDKFTFISIRNLATYLLHLRGG